MDTKELRQKILDLAIRGKLVPQDPNDEPASVLLERIRAEKERLIAEGKIKRPKKSKASSAPSHYQQFEPPFSIPDSWEWVRLEDVAKIGTGATPSKSNMEYYGGNINWVSSSVTSFPYVDEPTELITELALKETNCEIYPTGTLLMAMYGEGKTRGQVTELRIEAASNQACAAIIPYIPTTKNFVKLYLLANYYQLRRLAEGGNQPNLNLGKISTLFIPLPPLQEQQRIVKQYEFILEAIELLEASKALLVGRINLVKSKILDLAMQGKLVPQDPTDEPASDMLLRINPKAKIITDNPHYPQLPYNWVLTTIGSVCNYGDSDNVSVDGINSSDWVLELEDIEKDSGNIVAQKPKEERTIKGIRHRFVKGDVLYSKLRTYLNKVLVAPADGYCTTEIIPIKTYDCVIPEYLCAWLRSPFFLSYTAECCYGVKMPRLSTSDARKGIIPLPPTQEQRLIVQKLNEISESLEILSNSIH